MIFGCLAAGLLIISLWPEAKAFSGRDDVKLTKNITKSFSVGKQPEVDIINKYGKVVINGWDKDSVKVSVDIVAYGKNSDAVEKLISKVDVDFMHNANYLSMETEMSKRKGGFGNFLSDLEGYGKSFLNSHKITIDYTVYLPNQSVIALENKFGDVFLDRLEGSVNIDLSHGDLKARELNGASNISLSYGKGRVKYLKEGFIKLKIGEIDIQEGEKVSVESSSSELIFGDIKSLLLNSRNDKVRTGILQVLKGSGDFTDILVAGVEKELEINLEYGDFYVERIGDQFRSVLINSKAADVNLVLSPESYFAAQISGHEDRMIIPNSMLTLGKKDNSGAGYDFTLIGNVGPTRSEKGKVTIKSIDADLIISIKETGIFTRKN